MKKEGFLDGSYHFTQTDFLVMYCLNTKSMVLKEIIEETELSRNTVNTTLTRLIDKNQVERNMTANNYEYRLVDSRDEEFSNKEKVIFDFLIRYHKKILTGNVVWLIIELLEKGKYNIKDLREEGWKQAGLYKCTSKLVEAGIIEKTGDSYFFSENILKLVPVEPLKIATLNMNCYKKTKEDISNRINTFENKLSDMADIWALQDINERGLMSLQEKYKIIYPEDYCNSKTKNCENITLAVLLVRSDIYKAYTPLLIDNDGDFSWRYTYGILHLADGRKIRIMNLYIPQCIKATKTRKENINCLWDGIIEEVRKCRIAKEEVIILGDFNAYTEVCSKNNKTCEMKKITEMSQFGKKLTRLRDLLIDVFEDCESFDKDDSWKCTWKHEKTKDTDNWRRLDYIFVNHFIIYNNSIKTDVIENNISDHKGLWIEIESNNSERK